MTQFAGNIIPAKPFRQKLGFPARKFNPLPNINQATTGLPLVNYQYATKIPVDKDQVTERIDFKKIELPVVSDDIAGPTNRQSRPASRPTELPSIPEPASGRGEHRILSATKVNESALWLQFAL